MLLAYPAIGALSMQAQETHFITDWGQDWPTLLQTTAHKEARLKVVKQIFIRRCPSISL